MKIDKQWILAHKILIISVIICCGIVIYSIDEQYHDTLFPLHDFYTIVQGDTIYQRCNKHPQELWYKEGKMWRMMIDEHGSDVFYQHVTRYDGA